jgi:hypothetical protein
MMRSGSTVAADAVALKLTNGALDWRSLIEVAGFTSTPFTDALNVSEPDLLVGLARYAAVHHPEGRELDSLLDLALACKTSLSDDSQLRLTQLCVARRRHDDALGVMQLLTTPSPQRTQLLADLLNPFTGAADESESAWLALVNTFYRDAGIEPVQLADGHDDPFDRLESSANASSVGGPLVTVIMTAYQPDDSLITAVNSIRAQTWRDWELFIMDDASGPEFDAVFDRVVELDSRIRVFRAPTNGGTYVRRNEALARSEAEFVTMQDSDDWSHPRRLEVQIGYALAHPSLAANLVAALRVTSDLQFTQARGLDLRLSEPSLLFRRLLVTERIGFFDAVRKSADSEYRRRIGAVFGSDVPYLESDGPLMLMRFDAKSLSGADLADGWAHPARMSYRSSYQHWHDSISARGGAARLPRPGGARPFVAPPHITGVPRPSVVFDDLLVIDARSGGVLDRQWRAVEAYLRSASVLGSRVAVLHSSAYEQFDPAQMYSHRFHDWLEEGLASEVFATDDHWKAKRAIVWGDGCVLGLPRTGQIPVDSVVLLAGQAGADPVITSEFAEQACREAFDAQPVRTGVSNLVKTS